MTSFPHRFVFFSYKVSLVDLEEDIQIYFEKKKEGEIRCTNPVT